MDLKLSITFLVLGVLFLAFNGAVIGMSFKKAMPKVTVILSTLVTGFLFALCIFAIFAISAHALAVNGSKNAAAITLLIFWVIFLVGLIAVGIMHFIRLVFIKKTLY